jgi:hypothetical protein
MTRNILACYNELFAENAILFSQNTQINSVLADFVSVQYQPLARYVFPTRRRTRIISRCSTITCTLVGAIAIVHKSQLFTNATIATNANIRSYRTMIIVPIGFTSRARLPSVLTEQSVGFRRLPFRRIRQVSQAPLRQSATLFSPFSFSLPFQLSMVNTACFRRRESS